MPVLDIEASTGSRLYWKPVLEDWYLYQIERIRIEKNIDHPGYWSENVYLNRKSIRKFKNCDSNQNAQFITDFFVLITWVGPTKSSVFFIGDLSLVGESPSGVWNSACF